MSAFTSTQTGNWSQTATWGGSGPPGNGDTATIAVGHTVTVAADTTVGNSPAEGNAVITIQHDATLIVANGKKLTVRGDINSAGTIQLGTSAGAFLEFDSSAASAPSTTHYVYNPSRAWPNPHPLFKTRGSAASHCTVSKNAGGAPAYLAGQLVRGGYDCQWCDFSYLGIASVEGIGFNINGGQDGGSTAIEFTDCTFDHCGKVNTTGTGPSDVPFRFIRCAFTNSLNEDLQSLRMVCSGTSVDRIVRGCSFDKLFVFTEDGLTELSDSYLAIGYSCGSSAAWGSAVFKRNFVRQFGQGISVGGVSVRGNVTDSYFLADDDGSSNPHIIIPRDIGATGSLDGGVTEYTGASAGNTGDSPYGGGTWTYSNWTSPRAGDGLQTSGSVNFGGSDTISVTHFGGWCGASTNTAIYGESTATHTVVPSCEGNTFWTTNGLSNPRAIFTAQAFSDYFSSTGTQKNFCINLGTGTARYEATFSGTPGSGDTLVNSVSDLTTILKNPLRNLATWAVERGSASLTYATKVADALTYLAADPALTLAAVTHVRAGQAIINGTYKGLYTGGVDHGPCWNPTPTDVASADGTTVTLANWSHTLDTGVTPAAGDFVFKSGRTCSGVIVASGSVTLTGVSPAYDGTLARTDYVTYTPGTNKITAADGSVSRTWAATANDVTATGATLTADAGSFALSGVAAGLKATRLLTAATGAFTETGIAANLRAARKLTAAVASYTLTGNAASLRSGTPITVSSATIADDGNAIDVDLDTHGGGFLVAGSVSGVTMKRNGNAEVPSSVTVNSHTSFAIIPAAPFLETDVVLVSTTDSNLTDNNGDPTADVVDYTVDNLSTLTAPSGTRALRIGRRGVALGADPLLHVGGE